MKIVVIDDTVLTFVHLYHSGMSHLEVWSAMLPLIMIMKNYEHKNKIIFVMSRIMCKWMEVHLPFQYKKIWLTSLIYMELITYTNLFYSEERNARNNDTEQLYISFLAY